MCWGLQQFVGALHNRKLGSHCLQGLKQQAYPVSPPLWPCDNGRDMWPIIDKRQRRGGGFFFSFFWGKERQHFWIRSISALRPLLLRWLWDYRFLHCQMTSSILNSCSTAECQVFSKSISSACHEIPADSKRRRSKCSLQALLAKGWFVTLRPVTPQLQARLWAFGGDALLHWTLLKATGDLPSRSHHSQRLGVWLLIGIP